VSNLGQLRIRVRTTSGHRQGCSCVPKAVRLKSHSPVQMIPRVPRKKHHAKCSRDHIPIHRDYVHVLCTYIAWGCRMRIPAWSLHAGTAVGTAVSRQMLPCSTERPMQRKATRTRTHHMGSRVQLMPPITAPASRPARAVPHHFATASAQRKRTVVPATSAASLTSCVPVTTGHPLPRDAHGCIRCAGDGLVDELAGGDTLMVECLRARKKDAGEEAFA